MLLFFLTVNDAVTLLRTTTDGEDDSTDRRFARLHIMLNTRKWLFKWNIYIYVVNVTSTVAAAPRTIARLNGRSDDELNAIFVPPRHA